MNKDSLELRPTRSQDSPPTRSQDSPPTPAIKIDPFGNMSSEDPELATNLELEQAIAAKELMPDQPQDGREVVRGLIKKLKAAGYSGRQIRAAIGTMALGPQSD